MPNEEPTKKFQEQCSVVLRDSLTEVIQTLFSAKPQLSEVQDLDWLRNGQVAAMIGLSGSMNAFLVLVTNTASACRLVIRMLGPEIEAFDKFVIDGTGELVNILAGVVKTHFARHERKLELGLPSIVMGSVELSVRNRIHTDGLSLLVRYQDVEFILSFYYTLTAPSTSLVIRGPVPDAADMLRRLVLAKGNSTIF